jgi:transcriptional regulator of acetoin/glycerol metabolism
VTAKLAQHNGVIAHAAEAMGVTRQLLHRLLARHGLSAR